MKSRPVALPEDGCQVNGISVIASLVGHIQKGGNKKIDLIIAAPPDRTANPENLSIAKLIAKESYNSYKWFHLVHTF